MQPGQCSIPDRAKPFRDRVARYADSMSKNTIRVGLVMGYGLDFYRDILRGIKAFAETRPNWVFTPIAPDPRAVRAMRPLRHHGMIAHIFNLELAEALIEAKKPVVNVSGVLPDLPVPRVGVDHLAVGRLAAEHLLDGGHRHFAFVGYPDHAFSVGREEGFRATLEAAGFRVGSYHQADPAKRDPTGLWEWDEALRAGSAGSPGPLAFWPATTPRAWNSPRSAGTPASACLRTSPWWAWIMTTCYASSRPSLSSVALPAERIGFEAARLLNSLLMRSHPRRPLRRSALLLPPQGVVVRGSSDVLAMNDADVAAGAPLYPPARPRTDSSQGRAQRSPRLAAYPRAPPPRGTGPGRLGRDSSRPSRPRKVSARRHRHVDVRGVSARRVF